MSERGQERDVLSSGWTPLFDALAQEQGLLTAAVYGAVWRHCQRRDGICRASLGTLAASLGVNMSTVLRRLKALVKAGYLLDLTPRARNAPHVYRITDRLSREVQGRARRQAGAMADNHSGIAHSHSGIADSHGGIAHSHTGIAHSHTGIAHSQLKILDTKEERGDSAAPEMSEQERARLVELYNAQQRNTADGEA